MKASAPVLAALLAAALLVAGCGGSSSSSTDSTGATTTPKAKAPNAPAGSKVVSCGPTGGIRAAGLDCAVAEKTVHRWEASRACSVGEAARSSCALGEFRCQATRTDRGVQVSCARPGANVGFIAPRSDRDAAG